MTFTLKIACNNAAFSDDALLELARILAETAEKLRDGHRAGGVRDLNGNTVGTFALKGGR